MTGQLAPDDFYMTAKPTEVFGSSSFGGKGGSPFSGIEGLLMNYAMTDAMGSAQQNAQQKVGGVMSGIQSLVSEAFPDFSGGGGMSSGGMSTTGQLGPGTVGGGFNPPNQITQPTSPMGPTTIPPMLAPTPIEGGGGIGLPPSGFNTAFNGPKVPSFMDESGGIGLPPSFNMPKPPSFVPSGVGAGVDVKTNPTLNDVSVSQYNYNPALGFGGSSNAPQLSPQEQQQMMFKAFKGKGVAPAGLGIGNLLEEPPINLAYNTNMENSPF